MKSLEDIETMLVLEIKKCLDKNKSEKLEVGYFNEILGDISFLLAALLQNQLEQGFADWSLEKWIDDSLIDEVIKHGNKIIIGGIMIWGKISTTEQWTNPFYFDSELSDNNNIFNRYTFLFGELDKEEIPYKIFNVNRSYWNMENRNWKYIINSPSQPSVPK